MVVVRGLSDRLTATRRIERLAHFDTMTGVANRQSFGDRLAEAIDNELLRRQRLSMEDDLLQALSPGAVEG